MKSINFILCGELVLLTVTLLSTSNPMAEDSSDGQGQAHRNEFLRVLRQGPLVNSSPYQYLSESIFVPKASAEEARLEKLSVAKASSYLEQGAEAWNTSAKCVSCHTNGSYMAYRPALTPSLG